MNKIKVRALLREIKDAQRKNCPHIFKISQEIQDEMEVIMDFGR